MTRPYLVCGQCRHFTGKPHPSLGPFWKLCSALNHGVMADTTAAEHCEHFLPPRIQLRRTRGWKKPEGAIVVARPSRWGNPWKPEPIGNGGRWRPGGRRAEELRRARECVEMFRNQLLAGRLEFTVEDVRRELRGKALCCWCPLPPAGEPDVCHAAVLLEIANERSGGDGG